MNMDFVPLLLEYTYEVCSCLEVLYFSIFHPLRYKLVVVVVLMVVVVVKNT